MTLSDDISTAADAAREAACIMERAPQDPHTLDSLASRLGVSPGRLQRAFTRTFGVSPHRYLGAIRTGHLKQLLRDGVGVTDAGYQAGFGSNRATYEHARDGLGMAPSAYGRGGRGVHVAWGAAPTRFGDVVVGATARGVCCVLFLEDGDAQSALEAEFPNAELTHDGSALGHLAGVVAVIDGRAPSGGVKVPLDLLGTPFQRSVWAALREIPPGETVSYSDVARTIGRESAVRAVAHACATNHAAVLVPCHRVVRADRGLGGYRWGVERKADLLDDERNRPAR